MLLFVTYFFIDEVLAANDELGDVFDKYTKIIVQRKTVAGGNSNNGASSLLDLSTPSEESLPPPVSLLNEQLADLGIIKILIYHFYLILVYWVILKHYIHYFLFKKIKYFTEVLLN